MKNKSSLSFTLVWPVAMLLLSFAGCCNEDATDSFSELMEDFTDPPAGYRPAPLWVWNGQENEQEIRISIEEMKQAGFGGVFIHPRPGLVTEYLSEEWMSLYRFAVDECRKVGLDVWIYDENSYPSGFAGGYVQEQMPESYDQGQGLVMETADMIPDDTSPYIVILSKQGDGYQNITDKLQDYVGKNGDFRLFRKTYNVASAWNAGFPYVDLMVDGVSEQFIEITLDGYEQALGERMKDIKGVFSDEPQIDSPGGVRWTPDLFSEFLSKWGYSLEDNLPGLFVEEGNWRKVRHDYQSVLLDLFIDRWSVPMHDWCEKRELKWTGHYWEHNWPAIGSGPDNMAMYAYHQMPGVDMLFNQFNEVSPQAQFGNVRAIKELGSVANQMGYERTLSETYGGAGWDVTFEDMKRLGDWEYVLGVNFMNQHLVKMHLDGSRKYDYPPVFSKPNPWWPYYRTQNDYFSRLSVALSKGEQLNDILVMEPTTSLWCSFSVAGSNSYLWDIGNSFQKFVTDIEKAQVEYDLGCERILEGHARVEGENLIVGHRSYSTVVLPPEMMNIESSSLALLGEFVRNGGRLVLESLPEMVDGAPADVSEIISGGNVRYCKGTPEFISLLSSLLETRFNDMSGAVPYHQRRQYRDGQLLFMVNPSLDKSSSFSVSLDGVSVTEMDAFSGKCYFYPFRRNADGLSFNVVLPPAGSLLLFVHAGVPEKFPARDIRACGNEIASDSEMLVCMDSLNVLYVDFCDLELAGRKYESIHFADAAYKYYTEAGYNGNPWGETVQFRSEYVKKGRAPRHEDVEVRYHIDVRSLPDDGSPVKLVIEKPLLWRVSVNGRNVDPEPDKWWFDRLCGVFDIAGLLQVGDNTVSLETEVMDVFAEIEPVYVLGNFVLEPSGRGWSIAAGRDALIRGSWKDQGYPFYSWGVSYSRDFNVPTAGDRRFEVRLGQWKGTVAEVSVNGEYAGLIAYQPFALDVTGLVKDGENTVEVRIVGSMRNLQGPHHNNPPAGIGGPWEWKNIFGPMPPGEDYSLFDYGLYGDVELFMSDLGENAELSEP